METKYKTHLIVKVVLFVIWISGCGAEFPDYTDACKAKKQSVSLPSKLP